MNESAVHDHRRDGLFDPDGVFWRVNRESVLLIGGGAALLMQVAHPKIAAGVAEHSDFRRRPLRRLYRTVRMMQDLIYGDRQTALRTARGINQVHKRINGRIDEGTSVFGAGETYSAEDPELVVWVYATLIETMRRTYAAVFEPLSPREEQSFYRESRLIARLFGASDDLIPNTLDDFESYFQTMLDGPVLELTPTSRAVANDIIHPPIRGMPGVLGKLVSIPALALLPETLRDRYDLKWDRKREVTWRLSRRVLRRSLPYVPNRTRVNTGARKAEKRARLGPKAAR